MSRTVVRTRVQNKLGLHLRNAAAISQLASRYHSRIRLGREGIEVDAKSVMGVMSLAAALGTPIVITAEGTDSFVAASAIEFLFLNRFEEEQGGGDEGRLQGIPASPGIVAGPVFLLDRGTLPIPRYTIAVLDVPVERARLEEAFDQSLQQLLALRQKLAGDANRQHRAILEAHCEMLRDPALRGRAGAIVAGRYYNAEQALRLAVEETRIDLVRLEDSFFRTRETDLEYIADRVLRNLQPNAAADPSALQEDAVVIARRLSPGDAANLNPDRIKGIATDVGGPTCHTAIIARTKGIPAVMGLRDITEHAGSGRLVIIDGHSGLCIVNPSLETYLEYVVRRRDFQEWDTSLHRDVDRPARTSDRQRVLLTANIEHERELPELAQHGAEGIGLFRTEFLYLEGPSMPDEMRHAELYGRIVAACRGQPVTIRTFDLGGEKADPYARAGLPETNPALGLRAIRYSLKRRSLFAVQLRALLRCSTEGPVRIMFPMVASVDELLEVRTVIDAVRGELTREGVAHRGDIPIGIMIEVPAAVFLADALARHCDFFSIGTNDLLQYTLAVDRNNEAVSEYYDPYSPALFRMLAMVRDAAAAAGIPVSMCGELAARPEFTRVFLALGLHELSMAPRSVPVIKSVVAGSDMRTCRELLERVLRATTSTGVRQVLHDDLRSAFPTICEHLKLM